MPSEKTFYPASAPAPHPEEWKQELLQSYSSVSDLCLHHLISSEEAKNLQALGDAFKVRVTPYYAKLIENSLTCPIRLQAIPHLGEGDPFLPEWARNASQEIYGRDAPWHADAIGDIQNLAAPRLTHRYGSRALLHLSSMCAVYCRFCFRKSHLNDDERTLYEGSLNPAFEYLEKTSEIRELILTGGDPLSLSDAALLRLAERISKIPHITAVRIHSRMAVTLPSRFTTRLLDVLNREWPFNIVLVSHFNHPKEITFEAKSALKRLQKAGITLLNQSVLLKGVNASVDCLATLFQTLYETGVIPYYLHSPDWTPGTFHFRTSIESGRQLASQLRGRISGPALPDFILEIPQGHGKISLLEGGLQKIQDFPQTLVASDQTIGGAVYELKGPAVRQGQGLKHLYLDLYPVANST